MASSHGDRAVSNARHAVATRATREIERDLANLQARNRDSALAWHGASHMALGRGG